MFCMLINMKVFLKLTLLFLMGLARHAQSTLRHLKKEVRNETTFGSNIALTIYYTSNVFI